MRLSVFPDAPAVADAAAELVRARAAARSGLVLALPAGETPRVLYARLAARARAGTLDASRLRVVGLDEYRSVGAGDPRSFRRELREALLDALGVPPERHLAFDGLAPDPDAEVRRILARLAEWGGIDLCLLGLGVNGHVAFNEPGAPLDAGARVVRLAGETRARNFPGAGPGAVAPGAPAEAYTLGLAEILAAREVLLLVTGTAKRAALRAVVEGPVRPGVPASALRRHGAALVYADREAAGPAA